MVMASEMGEMRRDATPSLRNVFASHGCVLGANPFHCKVTSHGALEPVLVRECKEVFELITTAFGQLGNPTDPALVITSRDAVATLGYPAAKSIRSIHGSHLCRQVATLHLSLHTILVYTWVLPKLEEPSRRDVVPHFGCCRERGQVH
jgi:hypothetical protein